MAQLRRVRAGLGRDCGRDFSPATGCSSAGEDGGDAPPTSKIAAFIGLIWVNLQGHEQDHPTQCQEGCGGGQTLAILLWEQERKDGGFTENKGKLGKRAGRKREEERERKKETCVLTCAPQAWSSLTPTAAPLCQEQSGGAATSPDCCFWTLQLK